MARRGLGVLALAFVVAAATADEPAQPARNGSAKSRPKPDLVPGYELRTIEGFTVLLNRAGLAEADAAKSQYAVEPLDVLESELRALNTILVPKVLKPLQTVRIFVEWDNLPPGVNLSEEERARGARVVALYRSGSPVRAAAEGRVHPAKMNAVEIMTLKRLTEMHQPGVDKNQIILLHELCHVVHHVFLSFDNRDVAAAYAQAMDRGLYARAYARTSAPEYFAEISCAYLDQCNHFPRTAEDLKEHDPVGYRLMEAVWGKQETIQKARARVAADRAARERVRHQLAGKGGPSAGARPADPETIAAGKLDLIRRMIDDGRTERAREKLQELIRTHPQTRAAEEARKLLDRL